MEVGSVNDGVSCDYKTCEKRQRGSEICARLVGKETFMIHILAISLI